MTKIENRMLMIRSISIEVRNAIKISKLVESGEYRSFSAFIRESVEEKLQKLNRG